MALQPAEVEATPTLPVVPTATQASPSQAAAPESPTATAVPLSQAQDPAASKSSQIGAEVIAGIFMTASSEPQSSIVSEPTSQAIVSAGSQDHTIVKQSDGAVVVEGTTYSSSQVITIDGSEVSLASDGVVAGASTISFTSSMVLTDYLQTAVTLDGQTYSIEEKAGSTFVNGMQAQADSVVTVSGHAFSLGSSVMAIDDNTITYAAVGQAPTVGVEAQTTATGAYQTALTLDGQTYKVEDESGALFINGMQVETGRVVSVSGHVFSAGPSILEVDGTTAFTYASPTTSADGNSQIAELVVDGHTVTAEKADGGAVIDGKTLSNDQQTTISGTPISVGLDGLVVGTSTAEYQDVVDPAHTGSMTVLTIGNSVHTAVVATGNSGGYVVDGHTLSVGGQAITVNDQIVTAKSNGVAVMNSSRTVSSSTSSSPNSTPEATIQGTETGQTLSSTTSSGTSTAKAPFAVMAVLSLLTMILLFQ